MITVVYCTRQPKPEHIEHLTKTSGIHKGFEVIEIINNGESLTKAYNRGLKQATNNIVVFCHDDIMIETKGWGTRLLKVFEKHQDFNIIGVAGTKYLSTSGRWWENQRKMFGRVAHTHEGKTWLSTYSPDLGTHLEEVVVVDGVFFAVRKDSLKAEFNETVEGFHFYDVTFCFENYLKGAKIGVTTQIRVNHKSIGETNEQWESNRVIFADTFKDKLPANIKRVIRKGERLKILIGCLSFINYTGSELYVFELAKGLVKEGHEVYICANNGGPLAAIAKQLGIKLFSLQEPPNFKLGDGKWLLKSGEQQVVSEKNTLYKLGNIGFDILHLNHKPVTEHLLRLYPDTPIICSIHSEIISLEEPVVSPQINKYIAIRPEIKEYIVNKFNINPDNVDIIYNPIDSTRFKVVNTPLPKDKKRIIFVGTIDYLRRNAIEDLVKTTKNNGEELWIVGKKNETYLDDMIKGQDHVKYFPPTNDVEKLVRQCNETAGILLGRTTIEGWLCGKKGLVYDVDDAGNILAKNLMDIPDDIDKFKSETVIKQIISEYENVICS